MAYLFVPCLLLLFAGFGTPAERADSTNGAEQVHVPFLAEAPELQSFVQMKPVGEIARQMTKVSGFIQQTPTDGAPATQTTEVYLGQDDRNLYVVFVAFDTAPDKVRARMSRRENVFRDDIVEIMLDTFHDQRRAFAFVTNPLGVQWDALWTEGSGFDESFDTLWYSRGRLTDRGFIVQMTIPFKSLRFPSAQKQEWGVILLREMQRGSGEQSFWPRVSSRIEGRLNQAATLKLSGDISPGRNAQFIPYASYRTFRLLQEEPAEFRTEKFDPDMGIDAKLVLQDKYALDLTANPDFNQVESDQPQITANQRFEVFFPEKRPFFLENANFFNSPFNLVFTRRIGEPQFGARLTGKSGPYAIGGLLTDDQAPGKEVEREEKGFGKRALFSVVRVNRDIFEQSQIGFIYVGREFAGSFNRVGGFDSRLKLSRNWTSSLMGIWSWTRTIEGESLNAPAFNVQLDRGGRQFTAHYHYQDIGSDFRTETGFIPRGDIRDLHIFNTYRFRPEGKFLISWGPNTFWQRIWDQNELRLDETISGNLRFDFTGQTEFIMGYSKDKERLRPVDFNGLESNVDFSKHSWFVDIETATLDQFRVETGISGGTAINFDPVEGKLPSLADRLSWDIELNLLPVTKFRVDNNYIFFQLKDKAGGRKILSNHIFRSRWNWQFDRKLSLRLIFQYDVTDVNPALSALNDGEMQKRFNIDFLFTYLVNPWTALYAGVNSNYENYELANRNLQRTTHNFLNNSRQFFVKYSYLFRI